MGSLLTNADRSTPPREPFHAPPWNLTGRGYVVVMRFTQDFLRTQAFLDDGLRSSLRGTMAYWMFVDYRTADCGPYRELLFIPGRCRFSQGRFLTISRIYVSTSASVINGQRNWGIPKERCDFEVTYSRDRRDHIRLLSGGKPLAELAFQPFGPAFPMFLGLLPERWLTLGQHYQGKEFVYLPKATGRARLACLKQRWVAPDLFPDLVQGTPLACFAVDDFQMVFPIATVTEIAPQVRATSCSHGGGGLDSNISRSSPQA